jgi:hypothetical protein
MCRPAAVVPRAQFVDHRAVTTRRSTRPLQSWQRHSEPGPAARAEAVVASPGTNRPGCARSRQGTEFAESRFRASRVTFVRRQRPYRRSPRSRSSGCCSARAKRSSHRCRDKRCSVSSRPRASSSVALVLVTQAERKPPRAGHAAGRRLRVSTDSGHDFVADGGRLCPMSATGGLVPDTHLRANERRARRDSKRRRLMCNSRRRGTDSHPSEVPGAGADRCRAKSRRCNELTTSSLSRYSLPPPALSLDPPSNALGSVRA